MKRKDETLKIISEIFLEELTENDRSRTKNDVNNWDSSTQLALIIELETTFEFVFEIEEILSITNIGSILDLVEQKIS